MKICETMLNIVKSKDNWVYFEMQHEFLELDQKKNILRLIVKQNLYDMELVNREPWQIHAI